MVSLFIATFLTLLSPQNAEAEYRVFQLAIQDTVTGQTRVVTSTLDDIQYPEYNPIKKTETIAINDTWMCWKRSDHSQDPAQKYCPNPRGPASAGSTSSPSTSSP